MIRNNHRRAAAAEHAELQKLSQRETRQATGGANRVTMGEFGDAAPAMAMVEVRGWDPEKKEAIVGERLPA